MAELNDLMNTLSTEARNLSSNLSATCIGLLTNGTTNECLTQILVPINQTFGVELENTFNSSTNSSAITEGRPFIPRWWIQVFWSLLFGIMVLAAIIGNVVVIWIILANRQMRTVTNYFLLNLTIADLATAIFNAIFNFVFMLNSHWPFGQAYCVINNFIANLTIAASVFNITATSIDRFVELKFRFFVKKKIEFKKLNEK
jgi:tachykinin-like receptor